MKNLLLAVGLAVAMLAGAAGCEDRGDDGQVLNLYIWAEYMPASVLEKFTRRTGIRVNVDVYDSNETLLQKLQSGGAEYDVCVPSDYMTRILVQEKLVRPIDAPNIPGFANLDRRFVNRSFDPGNRHSVPYLWGTTGIGYNKQRVRGPVESWAVMFDEAYAGKILMLDDMRECFAAALRVMAKPVNTTDPALLRHAADMLKKQKALVRTYNSNDYDNILASGDVVLAHSFNGQIAKLAAKDPARFAFVIPREGGTVFQDNLVVPVTARHPEHALKFIAFILEPEIAAEIVNSVSYASANAAARRFIRPEIANNPAIYPPDDVLEKCQSLEDVGPAMRLLDSLWTEIKAE